MKCDLYERPISTVGENFGDGIAALKAAANAANIAALKAAGTAAKE